ncbi:inositol monophosphatase family protein [Planctomycetota bacterium]
MNSKFQLAEIVNVAEQAAQAAGNVLLEMRGKVEPREKAPADLVTDADVASQRLIFKHLSSHYGDFAFLGEEDTGVTEIPDAEYCWIVDPLDGTTNYVHGLENYCVSIGLRRGNQIVAGVIYDPNKNQVYSTIRGGGAFCNGERLQVSTTKNLSEALVAASFPARVPRDSDELKRFVEVLVRCQALRRLGSAALNMCFVAGGKLDAYWATSVKTWDVAAGLLLVEEAGGIVTNLAGEPLDIAQPRFVAGSTIELHRELGEVLRMAIE